MTIPGPGTPPPATPPGAPPPPRDGMSGAAKAMIGCAIAAVLVVVLLIVVFGAGAWFVSRELADADAGLGQQVEVSRTLNQLEEQVRFTPPPDGVVGDERASRFFAATDAAWEQSRDWAEDMQRRGEETREGGRRAGLGDAAAAMRGMGQSRLAIARALEEQRMPPSEYVWTGSALLHAHAHQGQPPEQSGVPAENLVVARRHQTEMRELARGEEDGRLTRGTMFAVAHTLLLTEGGRRVPGLDTLTTGRR